MIKSALKIFLIGFLILVLAVFYLSIFGLKTEKFNKQIIKNVLKINQKIDLNLKEVKYLLNISNFSINITTENPQILLEESELKIQNIKTNIPLKSLINNQISIDGLQITTKEIKLNDVIVLIRSFKNSPQLFILNTIIKDGFIIADLNLKFDESGKIKDNYQIKGSVKKGKFNLPKQVKLQNLNFDFNIIKSKHSLKNIFMEINNVKISSPLTEIKKNKGLFFVTGQVLSNNKKFNIQELKAIVPNLLNSADIKKIEFSSTNNFSFNINSNLKFNDLKIETDVNLKQLTLNPKPLKLKSYLPNFVEEIKFVNHKIKIQYNKDKFDINGIGNISLEDKSDSLSYQFLKNNDYFSFNSKVNLKSNSLLINFLDFKKKEGHSSLVSVKGNFKKNDKIKFDFISLKEKNNKFLINGLVLNKNFKIINIDAIDVNYKNNINILNKFRLKKENLDFNIEGESFDATKLINTIMVGNEKDSSIFHNINSTININIKKTYIDEINYMNNLTGSLNYDDNKIKELKLESIFPNGKKINLSVKINDNLETITRLFTSYPKPLIQRYPFIKGFEGGYLNFNSSKKGGVSSSILVIDNFKVKKVPVFAKLLSLASLQGIADLLTGEGIRFTDLEMSFSNYKGLTTIKEMYAIGPAVSILMDGYIDDKKLVSLRGTLVPATTINRSIASIPLLGKILIGDKMGEGVFGVSFKIKGSPKDLKTTVNPIKSLTPRFITRTLEKIKKN